MMRKKKTYYFYYPQNVKFNGGFHYKTWDYQCPSYLRLFDLDLGKEFSLLEQENTKAVQAAKEAASLLPDFHRLHYFLIHTTTTTHI